MLELSDECSESPDPISVELDFMHLLCIKEAEAANHGDLHKPKRGTQWVMSRF